MPQSPFAWNVIMTSLAATILVGKTITAVEVVEDYFQFSCGSDIYLTIYNDYEVYPHGSLSTLRGRVIEGVSESATEIRFVFEGDAHLSVKLEAQAWHGPEAMLLWRRGQPLIVWN